MIAAVPKNKQSDLVKSLQDEIGDLKKQLDLKEKKAFLFDQILNNTYEGIRVINKDFEIIHTNEVYARFNNLKPEEIIGNKCFNFLCSGNCKNENCTLKKVLYKKSIQEENITSFERNGTRHYFKYKVRTLLDENGDFYALQESFVDMTTEKLIEKDLLDNKQKYYKLFNSANDAIYIVDAETRQFIDFNSVATKQLGYTREELLQLKIDDVNPKITTNELKDIEDQLKTKGKSVFEREHVRKDGTTFPVEISSRIFHLNNTRIWQSIVRDITDRKQVELNLKKFAIVTEKNPIGIVFTDPEGKIEYVNQKIIDSTGYTREELVGNNPKVLNSDYHDDAFYKDMWETISNGKIWNGTFRNKKKDGQIYWEKATISPLHDENGDIINYIGMKEDITEQVLAQQELENYKEHLENLVQARTKDLEYAKEKAEESNKLKSAFLANLSHEIRTPLNAIMGFSQMIISPNISNDKQNLYYNYISDAAKRLLSVIEDIIDISKIRAGSIKLHNTNENLNEIFYNLFAIYAPKAEDKKLQFNCRTALPDSACEISIDKSRFMQILNHFLENAFKFTEDGEIEFGYTLKDNTIEFYVKDTGIGIPEDKKHHIFEYFSQLESSDSKLYGGIGLGLALAKSFIQKMGGSVQVESVPDKGSRFSFKLPSKLLQGPVVQEAKGSSLDLTGKTILIAEDEDSNFFYLFEKLASSNAIIRRARNGKDVIHYIQNYIKPDVILMDIKMPQMNGIETLQKLKEMNEQLPVIAQTAYNASNELMKIDKIGFDAYIQKPIDINKLFQILNKILK